MPKIPLRAGANTPWAPNQIEEPGFFSKALPNLTRFLGGSLIGRAGGPMGAVGGGVSEIMAQALEGRFRPVTIGTATLAGSIPFLTPSMLKVGSIAQAGARGAGLGAGEMTGRTLGDEGRLPSLGELGAGAGVGGAIGGGGLALFKKLGANLPKAQVPENPIPAKPTALDPTRLEPGEVDEFNRFPRPAPTGGVAQNPADKLKRILDYKSQLGAALKMEPSNPLLKRQLALLDIEVRNAEAAAKAAENTANVGRIDDAIARGGLEELPPNIGETVSAVRPGGAKASMRTQYGVPEEGTGLPPDYSPSSSFTGTPAPTSPLADVLTPPVAPPTAPAGPKQWFEKRGDPRMGLIHMQQMADEGVTDPYLSKIVRGAMDVDEPENIGNIYGTLKQMAAEGKPVPQSTIRMLGKFLQGKPDPRVPAVPPTPTPKGGPTAAAAGVGATKMGDIEAFEFLQSMNNPKIGLRGADLDVPLAKPIDPFENVAGPKGGSLTPAEMEYMANLGPGDFEKLQRLTDSPTVTPAIVQQFMAGQRPKGTPSKWKTPRSGFTSPTDPDPNIAVRVPDGAPQQTSAQVRRGVLNQVRNDPEKYAAAKAAGLKTPEGTPRNKIRNLDVTKPNARSLVSILGRSDDPSPADVLTKQQEGKAQGLAEFMRGVEGDTARPGSAFLSSAEQQAAKQFDDVGDSITGRVSDSEDALIRQLDDAAGRPPETQSFTGQMADEVVEGAIPTPAATVAPPAVADALGSGTGKPRLVKKPKPGATLGSGFGGLAGLSPDQALTAGGAAVGGGIGMAMAEDDEWLAGAIAGAGAGAVGVKAGRMLYAQAAEAFKEMVPQLRAITSSKGLLEASEEIANFIPRAVRANLLAGPNIFANTFGAPYGSLAVKVAEAMMAGDPEGKGARLAQMLDPRIFAETFKKMIPEASKAIQTWERAGETASRSFLQSSKIEQLTMLPGTYMTAGDMAARRIAMSAGFSEAEARTMTLTSEPRTKLMKAIVRVNRSGPAGALLLPFARVVANIWEQGIKRTPFVGNIYNKYHDPNITSKAAMSEQALGAGAAATGFGAGVVVGDNNDKNRTSNNFLLGLLRNSAGPASLLMSAGLAGGQAYAGGRDVIPSTIAATGRELPLPSLEVPLSYTGGLHKLLSGEATREDIPAGAMPTIVKEILRQKR